MVCKLQKGIYFKISYFLLSNIRRLCEMRLTCPNTSILTKLDTLGQDFDTELQTVA